MRTNRLFHSIRFRFVIIYLILSGIILGVIMLTFFSMFENYIVNERIQQEITELNSVTVRVASSIESSDSATLYNTLDDFGNQYGGRWIVMNNSAIVIADSFSSMNGVRIDNTEVKDVLINKKSLSYGYHRVMTGENNKQINWSVYYVSAVRANGRNIGMLLRSSSIQDIVDILNSMSMTVLWVFLYSFIAIVVATIVSTNIIINPIKKLNRTANKISAGDLSQRVNVTGSSEISEFGNTFNMMCDAIQDIDKQRSEFVSNASHELKTPLASMKILVESLLYQDNVDEKYYKEFLSDINNEIDRLTNLVNDLLLLSKMDGNNAVLNISKTSINTVIEEVINSLKPLANEKGVPINYNYKEPVYIECDKPKIFQALYNIVNNAIKYSSEGESVDIDFQRNGNNIEISVTDHGVGMTDDQLPLIFERFYRVDKDRARETGGSGLGLHIVRRIALLHKGNITVESKKGEGSKFTLILPITISLSVSSDD